MRNLLAGLALVVMLLLGLGASRGWYTVESADAPSGKLALRFEMDLVKIGQDAVEAANSIQERLAKNQEKTD